MTMLDAVVGGLVGGAFVTSAVLLDHWLQRIGDRRRRIEVATHQITNERGRVFYNFTVPDPMDDQAEAAWWDVRNAYIGSLAEVYTAARWPLRRRRQLRAVVNDLLAELIACQLVFDRGRTLAPEQVLGISARRLTTLVFGDRQPLTEQIEACRARLSQGLPATED